MPAPEDFESWWTVVKLLQKDQELNTKRTALAAAELNQSTQATYLPGQTRSWLSKATHKRLIAKEVPRRLAEAVVKTAQLVGWKSAVAGSTRDLLHTLLNAMLKVSDQGSTVPALRHQLKQSGLLTALPGILTTAAQEVSTYAEDPAQLAALFDNASRGSGSASGAAMNTVHGTTPFFVSSYTSDLLQMPRTLQKLFGEDNLLHTPLASSVQPAVQLAAVAVGLMCSSMQQQQQQQEDAAGNLGGSLSHLLEEVRWTMHTIALMTTNAISAGAPVSTAPTASGSNARRSTRRHGAPQQRHHQQQQQQQGQELVQQLLVSPSWLRVSGFLLVAHCYALLRSQQPAAPPPAGGVSDNAANTTSMLRSSGAGSSSGTGSSSGNGSSSSGDGSSSSSGTGSSSSSGTGSSSSSGDGPSLLVTGSGTGRIDTEASAHRMAVYGMYERDSQASNHAANFAADWQDELPASHVQLLQLLGCSSKCVLWAAGLLAAQNRNGVLCNMLCGLAAARTITAQWVRACIPRQGQDSVADAASIVVDAAPDVLLATVTLHCAAHLNPGSGLSDPQTEAYVKLCKTAAMLASAAWAVPFSIIPQLVKAAETQAAPLGAASEQLQTALSVAQQLAAAEGEQVFFLQHVTSQLLGLLREHAEVLPHMQHAAAPLIDGGRSSGSSSSPSPVTGDAASIDGDSQGYAGSNSSSTTYAVSAVAEALKALDGARGHFSSRAALRITHTSNEGTLYTSCQVLSNVTSDCARVGVHTPLAACFQDCVRLGAVVEQLQPQREVIRTWCELFGASSPVPSSLLLGGLTTPPGSPQQQQLFGLMCSLLKTVQPKPPAPTGAQSDSQQDVQTCHKVVMTVLEVAAAAVNLQLPQAAVPWAAAVDSSTQGQPAAASATAGSVATSAAAAAPQATNKCSSDSAGTLSMVPWLVLMGRCYLILALPLYSSSSQHAVHEYHTTWLSRLQLWLQGSNTSADLAVAGLNPIGLWQAVQDTLAALQTLQDNNGTGTDVGPSTGLPQQEQEEQQQQDQAVAAAGISADLARQKLHALGVCLSSLPLSWGCSSPVCTNLQGPTEAGIVQGKGHVCKGCHMARYCDKACQALHWKHHKPVCKAIAAAAAAVAAKH